MTISDKEEYPSAADTLDRHPAGVAGLRFLKASGALDRSRYPLLDIDRAMERAGLAPVLNLQDDTEVFAWKAASKLRLAGNCHRSSRGPVLVAFMGFSEYRTLPFAFSNELIPYCFDCWPSLYGRWEWFFKRHRVRTAFISARQSAEHFARIIPGMRSVWLPEATDPSEYDPSRPWSERDIDVLELSRRDPAFHDRITGPLAAAKRTHRYMLPDGKLLFEGKAGLVDGMSRSKISMCFPKSQTHPQIVGCVETVTHRYFESIASKCLVVGHGPQELTDLFGYKPVIEVEVGQEAEQLNWLLDHPEASQELVERNYRRLLEVGTWHSRVATMVDALRASARANSEKVYPDLNC